MRFNRLLACATLLVLVSCSGPSHESGKNAASAGAPVAVHTVVATAAQEAATYEATGTVRAQSEGTVASKLMGYVREVRVREGDTAAANQVLVTIEARDLEAARRQAESGLEAARQLAPEADQAIAAAQAGVDLAESTYRRMKELFDKKSISNQEYDEASAKVKLARAQLEMARARRRQIDDRIRQAERGVETVVVNQSYTEVRAPFAGRVTSRRVEPGDLAAPGAPLLAIERAGAFRFEAGVEESRLGSIRVGQPVTVVLDAGERSIAGRVSEIVPTVDAASRTFIVKINLPPAGISSGLFGRARFEAGEKSVLRVPVEAVSRRGQLESVLVADEGVARERLVTLGGVSTGGIEVLSGLREGERIIVPRPAGVVDGARVEVRP